MAQYCALVPGVTGTVGKALARYLASQPEWQVIGIARRVPSELLPYPVISLDLADRQACLGWQASFAEVTHILYCARAAHVASVKEPIEDNLAMLRNLLDAVEPVAEGLCHAHIVQGSKVYGSDLGPYRTPAKESDPRVPDYNWYYAQEDLLVERSRGQRWHWSASRPHGVVDPEPGVARSMPLMIGVYAAISKALGLPLSFTGTVKSFHSLYQSVDATLLAQAIAWITTQPQCADQAFNVTNGDFIRWENLWPGFAQCMGMPVGPVKTARLTEWMADKAPVWEAIVKQHGLRPTPFAQAGVWSYADFNWQREHDIMSDTGKLRRSGFAQSTDTEAMFMDMIRRLRQEHWIP
jgi:nucleoside-diphosphate-sugar epimerase